MQRMAITIIALIFILVGSNSFSSAEDPDPDPDPEPDPDPTVPDPEPAPGPEITCYSCTKHLPISQANANNLIVGLRPPCEILYSANQAEIIHHTKSCEFGCVKISGSWFIKDGIGSQIEIRDCLDTTLPFQNLNFTHLSKANYTCPNTQPVLVAGSSLGDHAINITMSMCACGTDYCNSNPIYISRYKISDEDEVTGLNLDEIAALNNKTAGKAPESLRSSNRILITTSLMVIVGLSTASTRRRTFGLSLVIGLIVLTSDYINIVKAEVKCYACNPNGREVGTRGKGQVMSEENLGRNSLYLKGACDDWNKASETTRKGFRFTKTCSQGCLYGTSESKYSATATQNGLTIEEKVLNMYGTFKGCFGTGNEQGTPLKMGGCVDIYAADEVEQSMPHPDNGDVIIRTKGLEGKHHICGCDKDFCNLAPSGGASTILLATALVAIATHICILN